MFEDFFNKYVKFKYITFTIVLLLFLFFVFNCKDIAIMFFASFVIACSLNPIVDKLSERIPRHAAAVLVAALSLLIILAIFVPVCIMSIEQIKIFLHKLPHYLDNFDEYILGLPILNHFGFLANDADDIMEQLSLSSSDVLNKAMDAGKYIGSFIMYLLVSIIIVFNLITDKTKIKEYYLKSFPSNMRKKADEVGKIIAEKMGGYVIALLATTLSVGIVMLIGLLIFRVPYAILLATITAAFDIIPVVGPAIALIICLLATYDAGTGVVLAVIAVFAVAQFVENNIVRPYVFGKVMHVHPIIIFLFLFITAEYIGIIGVIFAPAIAALFAVLFEELYLKKLD